MNKEKRLVVILAAFLVVVSIGIGTAIAVTLFYHHMPAVLPNQTLVENCDPLLADPATVTAGSSGQITFYCASPSPSALTVGGSSIVVTPIFLDQGFRTPYVTLWLYKPGGVASGTCSGRTGAVQLQNNTAMTLSLGNYNYCAEYVGVANAGLRPFLCRWEV